MDGYDHKSTSSSSNSNKQRPPIPKGVDENGGIYQEIDKLSKTKHFMSPTISATSKFSPSRKRILGERNESFDNLQKTPNLDSKSIQKATISDRSERNVVSDDSSSKPYDPLTNYLSPRPRFLRYKPNRRRQILLRKEIEEQERGSDPPDADSETDSSSSCGSFPQSQSNEIDDSDDEFEFEEVEDERCWSFRGAFKVLILLLVLVLFTSYISSMNSPTPSSIVIAVSGLKNRYDMMQNHVYEYVNRNFLLFEIDDNHRVNEENRIIVDDVRMEESSNELKEIVDLVEDEEEEGEGEVGRFSEDDEEIVELDEEIVEEEEEEEEEDSENNPDFSDSEVPKIADVSVFKQVVEEPSSSVTNVAADALEKEGFVHIIEGIFERERGGIGNVTDDVHKIRDDGGNSMIKSIESMQIESVLKVVIGFLIVLSSIFASRVLLRRRHNSSRVVEPCYESVIAHVEEKKPIESVAAVEEEKKKIESSAAAAAHFGISKSVINSMEEEASKATTQEWSIRSLSHERRAAPVIELLGELELSEMSTSLRSCGIKNSRLIENEVSSFSISMEKTKSGSKPVHVSIFNSPPYPDEKKQLPLKKKEREGGDAEGRNVLTTPVRRSSRIRNRAFSP